MVKKKTVVRHSTRDNILTMYQTLTVREIAKRLKVDRRTVQRWKNQGMQPKRERAEAIEIEANERRREFVKLAKSKREHLPIKPVAVPLMGSRGYVGEEVTQEKYNELKARAKTDPRFKYERFLTRKDKRGKKHYFRYQPSNTFQFDIRRAPDDVIAKTLLAYRGEKRAFSFSYSVTTPYETDSGETVKRGVHKATQYERLDLKQFSTEEQIIEFIRGLRTGRRLLTLRLTDTGK